MKLAREVYKLSAELPKEEKYGLSDQLRRSAVSIPSNIAEGRNRSSRQEFHRFLKIALGSIGELETQLILASDLYKIDTNNAYELLIEVRKMLHTLVSKIQEPETSNLKPQT